MALNVDIEKRPNSIVLIVLLIISLGVYMALISVHALITQSEYIGGILILANLSSFDAGVISLILAVFFFILGYSLWNMQGLSRTIILVFAGLGVVFYPLKGLLLAATFADPGYGIKDSDMISGVLTVLGIIFSIIIIFILSKQEVILAFEANEMVRIKRRISHTKEKLDIGRKRCDKGEITKAELSKLRSECLVEERTFKGRIRHFEKVRLTRERKIKERLDKKKETIEKKKAKQDEKKAQKEEKKEKKEKEKEEEEEKEEEKKEEEEEEKEEKENNAEKKKSKKKGKSKE